MNAALLQVVKDALDLARRLLGTAHNTPVEPWPTTLAALLVRATRCAHAVVVLCEHQLSEEALLQGRAVWEAAVLVEYIRQDPSVRARLFVDYDAIARHRYVDKARRHQKSPWSQALLADAPGLNELEARYAAARPGFPDELHWAGRGMTAKAIAKAVGLEADYDFLYGWLSERVHGSVTPLFKRLRASDEQFAVLLEDDAHSDPALTLAAGWLLHIIGVYNETFDCQAGGDIQNLLDRLQ